MQAVILAAGEGKRMLPLTADRPKPLIEVAGKPILAHILDALPDEIDDVFIVIGYKGGMIRSWFGDEYDNRRLHYIIQERPTGTAHALGLVRPYLKGTFLLLNGDDIQDKESLSEAIQYPLAVLVATHENPSKFGVVEVNGDGTLKNLEEKPTMPKSNLVSTGSMVLDERIFLQELIRHESGEYYLPDQLAALAREAPVHVIVQTTWIPAGYPEDLLKVEAHFACAEQESFA